MVLEMRSLRSNVLAVKITENHFAAASSYHAEFDRLFVQLNHHLILDFYNSFSMLQSVWRLGVGA